MSIEEVKKKGSPFFCDRIHQSLKGNILTAKIINNYLKKAFISSN